MSFSVLNSPISETSSNKEPDTVYSLHFALFQNIPLLLLFHGERGYSSQLMRKCLWSEFRNGHSCVNRAVSHSAWNVLQVNRSISPPAHSHSHICTFTAYTAYSLWKPGWKCTSLQAAGGHVDKCFFFFQQVVKSYSDHQGNACGQINVSFKMQIQTWQKLTVSKACHNRAKAEV